MVSAVRLGYSVARAVEDGLRATFVTQLEADSRPVFEKLLASHKLTCPRSSQTPAQPSAGNWVEVEGFWIPQGSLEPETPNNFLLTPSVRLNLQSLVRAVAVERCPILLQGPTSAGKTSLVEYLSRVTGHPFVRINNHAHTDVQEYIGCFTSGSTGHLVFQEGPLVTAVRNGHWVVLDELNLAPSEVEQTTLCSIFAMRCSPMCACVRLCRRCWRCSIVCWMTTGSCSCQTHWKPSSHTPTLLSLLPRILLGSMVAGRFFRGRSDPAFLSCTWVTFLKKKFTPC